MAGEWLAQLPDDLKVNDSFTSYETLGDFGKAHVETLGRVQELDGKAKTLEGKVTDLEGKIANSIPKLSDRATDEERASYYKAIGRPDKAEEYEIPVPEGGGDPGVIAWARQTFHKAGLSKEQAALVGQEYNAFMGQVVKGLTETKVKARNDAETALKTEWGTSYNANLELTRRAFKKFSDAEFDAFLNETGIGNHPVMIKAFHAIGKAMGEDTSPTARPGGGKEPEVGIKYNMPDFK